MIRPRRRKSNTTLLAMAFDNWFLVGSDSRITCAAYGRVLDNSYVKIHPIYDNVLVCWSGNDEMFQELKKASPHDVVGERRKKPTSIALAAEVMADWVNFYTKENKFIVNLLVVGGIGNEKYKVFNVRQDPKTANSPKNFWKHSEVEVKGRMTAVGSGGSYAFKFLKENTDAMNKKKSPIAQMGEDEAINLAFDAIHAAVLKDWASGGTLRVDYQTRATTLHHHIKAPIIPEYCNGGYHPIQSS